MANTTQRHHIDMRNTAWRRWILAAVLMVSTGWASGMAAIWAGARWQGHTTDEVMQYLQRRVSDHPKLRVITDPSFSAYAYLLGVQGPPTPGSHWLRPSTPAAPPSIHPANLDGAASKQDLQPTNLLRVGRFERYTTIGAAAKAATDHSIIEVEPGDYVSDTAVFTQRNITVRARGAQSGYPSVRLIASGASAQSKGIWVVQSGSLTVEGIAFSGARVPDRNGAGIRLENAKLTVRHCLFHANENGILAAGFPTAELVVEQSEFSYNGHGDGYSHGIYAGAIAYLRVTGSYFHHGNIGHHIKSRARASDVIANRITDESGGRASYELDFPNGGRVLVSGNLLQQGEGAANSTLVAYGAEGYADGPHRLVMINNTVVNDHPRGGTMVRIADGPRQAVLARNLWVGIGGIRSNRTGLQEFDNRTAQWSDFNQASRYDYTLRQPEHWAAKPPPPDLEIAWPRTSYRHRLELVPLDKDFQRLGAP